MKPKLAIIALLLLCVPCMAQTPATETQAAYLDCEAIRKEVQPGIRYLTLCGIPKDDRQDAAKALSYTLNCLSRSRVISAPVWVSDSLARFSIINYAPTNEEYRDWKNAWETLAASDPYFGIVTEVLDPTSGKSIVTRVAGGWTLPHGEKLKAWTGSQAPVLRADWFMFHALSAPNYYNFAGIPDTEAAFLKSIGVDQKTIEKLRANSGANLFLSQVTFKPRRIVWSQGPLGGVYVTYDVGQVDAERDPFRRPINAAGLKLRYDATEWFAMSPNGFWRMALYDADGKQQQAVPPEIAADRSDPHAPTTEVIPALSCIRCHVEGGLRPFADDQVKLLAKAPVGSYDPTIANRVSEFYQSDKLQRQMEFDRGTHEAAVKQATGGLTTKELSEALASVVRNFEYLPVTVDQAALEVGLTADDFKRANISSADPVILNLVHDGKVLRGQFEGSFQEAMLAAEAWRTKE